MKITLAAADAKDNHLNPKMITLARESRGFTQKELSERLSVTPGWLSRVEGGLRGIQEQHLKKLSRILDYPVEFFYLKQPIYGPGITEVFHRKRQSLSEKMLCKIHANINVRTMNISELLNGVDIGDVEIRPIELSDFDGSAKEVARIVRASWNVPRGPIDNLTSLIENARGIVIPCDFTTNKIDAVSRWPIGMPPLFFVNKHIPSDRLRFTLCHELGHIIMHQNTVDPFMESQADEFSAEFLMPEKEIRPYLTNVTLDKLAVLKPYWKVSMAALLKRATDLGVISARHARTLWMNIGKAGYRVREPVELDISPEPPFLQDEIVNVYLDDMEYTVSELGNLLKLFDNDVSEMYLSSPEKAKNEEYHAAVKEFEKIVKRQL